MRVLYVTMDPLESNTSANIRNRGLIYGLAENGWRIDTLSLKPDIQSACYDDSMTQISQYLNKQYFFQPNGFYQRFRTKKPEAGHGADRAPENIKSKLRRRIKSLVKKCFLYDLQRINVRNAAKVPFENRAYDLIISSSDPKSAHLIVRRLMKRNKIEGRWIQYWGDPMLLDITAGYGKIKRVFVKKAEGALLGRADKIVYTSPLTLTQQQELFQAFQHKMSYAVQACAADGADNGGQPGIPPTLGYFGNYSSDVRDILPLCKAAAALHYPLLVAGDGDVDLNEIGEVEGIHFFHRLPYEEARKMESDTDIVLALCNKRGTQIPGKLYYVAGYQKPVVLILDGEHQERLRSFFGQFHRYILCENTQDSIIRAIHMACDEIRNKKTYELPIQLRPEYVARRLTQ